MVEQTQSPPTPPAPPSPPLRRTPLHDIHVSLGAKMVPFGGYLMPVSYARSGGGGGGGGGVAAGHRGVREAVGIFDVAHMGEVEITRPGPKAFVQPVCCNDLGAPAPGQA